MTLALIYPPPANVTDYTSFLRQVCGFNTAVLPDASPWIPYTLQLSLDTVNCVLICVAPNEAVLAQYNLAADTLINYVPDQPGQTFFADFRKELGVNAISTGVVTESHDEATGSSFQVPDQFKELTLGDLQTLKTPYGRAYMAFAQKYGQTLWGRS